MAEALKTTQALDSSAEICRQQGWGPGTVLVGEALEKEIIKRRRLIQITAVGATVILAHEVIEDREGFVIDGDEAAVDLHCRDWRLERKAQRPEERS